MRGKLVAGNWKMHHTILETRQFIETLRKSVAPETEADVLIAPSFTCLESARKALEEVDSGLRRRICILRSQELSPAKFPRSC